jgi:hypothetical protein
LAGEELVQGAIGQLDNKAQAFMASMGLGPAPRSPGNRYAKSSDVPGDAKRPKPPPPKPAPPAEDIVELKQDQNGVWG